MDRIRAFLNLERGEEVPVFLLFLYLTLALASTIAAKAVRDSLFLVKFGPKALPWVYVAAAVLMTAVVGLYVRLASRLRQATLISATLAFFISNLLLLWWGARLQWKPLSAIYYLWTGLFGVIVTTQVWTVANLVMNVRQAKRIFPLIASGGVLGGMLGGLLAKVLVQRLGTENLVLAPVPMLVVAIGLAIYILRRYAPAGGPEGKAPGSSRRKMELTKVGRTILDSPYLRLVGALMVFSTMVALTVDIQFKTVAQRAFSSKDQLTAFFGAFYAYIGLFGFLLQFLAGSRIVEKFGVRATIFFLPVSLLLGNAALLAFPGRLWAGIVLKGSNDALRFSIDKSSSELLYQPVPLGTKADIKAFIDMMLHRLSDGLGGVFLLVLTSVFGLGLAGVSVFNLCLVAVWLFLVFAAREQYVVAVRDTLTSRPALPQAALRMVFSHAQSIASLKSMLESRDEETVLYALELAQALRRQDLLSSALLTHASPRVRMKALEVLPLSEAETLEQARSQHDSVVRASAILRACQVAQPAQPGTALSNYLQAPDFRIRLAALVCLARQSDGGDEAGLAEVLARLQSELDENAPQWKDVAETLGDIQTHSPAVVKLHSRLLQHADPAVRKRAILSAGRAQHRELAALLISMLGDANVAAEVRQALREYGPRIVGTLGDTLKDPSESPEVRRSIPLVLANIPCRESADLLLEALFDYDGLLRYRAIRALGKLRLIDPELRFDTKKLSDAITAECEKARHYLQARHALYPRGESPDLLASLLKEKVEHGRERVFRLLALLLPPTTACASFLALQEDDRLKAASVVEYLDNVLPRKLKPSVLPLVEQRETQLKSQLDVRTILETFVHSLDPVLRECATAAIGKNRWAEFPGAHAA